MIRRLLRIPVVETSAFAAFISQSESLQFDALSHSWIIMRLRQIMKEESLAPFCLHQDIITTAKELREIRLDIDPRTRELQYGAQLGTLLPPAMQVALAEFSVNVNQSVMMGKCKPGRYVGIWHHSEVSLRF